MKPSELIDTPEKWTKGCAARTVAGVPTSSWSKDACCWCIWGGFNKCYDDAHIRIHKSLHKANVLKIIPFGMCFSEWQDQPERTHAEVLAVLKAVGE